MKTALLALALTGCEVQPAAAQPCVTDTQMIEKLSQFGEQIIFIAPSADGTAVAVWANQNTETWTVTESDGRCSVVRSYGEGFALIPFGEGV